MNERKRQCIIDKLRKENDQRWIGKPHYDCLSCSHSMSTEDNKLICVQNELHKQVDDEHVCEEWI
jgi:hypothetical protein